MEWILLYFSVLANVLLIVVCICLKKSRDWYKKSWYELANYLSKRPMRNEKMTARGLVTIIAASCFVADCLAILVRAF